MSVVEGNNFTSTSVQVTSPSELVHSYKALEQLGEAVLLFVENPKHQEESAAQFACLGVKESQQVVEVTDEAGVVQQVKEKRIVPASTQSTIGSFTFLYNILDQVYAAVDGLEAVSNNQEPQDNTIFSKERQTLAFVYEDTVPLAAVDTDTLSARERAMRMIADATGLHVRLTTLFNEAPEPAAKSVPTMSTVKIAQQPAPNPTVMRQFFPASNSSVAA